MSMSRDRAAQAARILAVARQRPMALGHLPEPVRPASLAESYLIQDALHDELERRGLGRVAGWKIGCTTPVMQAFLDIPSPCAGGVLGPAVHLGSGTFRRADFWHLGVECEVAVRLARDVDPVDAPFSRDSVAGFVGAAMASIEIVDDRYEDYHALGVATLVADDFFNAGVVLGPEVADWRAIDLAGIVGEMWVNGESVGTGVGRDILGHPLEALAWLANSRAAFGRSLGAGTFVSLGSLVQTRWVEAGDHVRIRVGALGEAEARFT